MHNSKSYNHLLFKAKFKKGFIPKRKKKSNLILKELPPGNWNLIRSHDEKFVNTVV